MDVVNLLNSLSLSSEGGILRGKFSISTPGFQSKSDRINCLEYLVTVVCLLGNLGVTKEVREKILHFCPEVLERVQTLESSLLKHAASLIGGTSRIEERATQSCLSNVSRTKTILESTLLNSTITEYNYDPPISTKTFKFILAGKFFGLLATQMYKEALDILDLDPAPDIDFDNSSTLTRYWDVITFAKVMVEDYSGALTITNEIFKCQQRGPINLESARAYAHRGMLNRLSGGSLVEAVADFDVSLNFLWSNFFEKPGDECLLHIYYILKQRGFAKHLSGDNTGARTDAQTAQDLQLRNLVWDSRTINHPGDHVSLLRLRTDYLGFVFSL